MTNNHAQQLHDAVHALHVILYCDQQKDIDHDLMLRLRAANEIYERKYGRPMIEEKWFTLDMDYISKGDKAAIDKAIGQ